METNWNQLIERYLNNELSAEGKAAFEAELNQNKELQQEFELHKLTTEIIQRDSLRTMVQASGKWFHGKKLLLNSGIALVLAGVLAAAVYLAVTWKKDVAGNTNKPAIIEQSMLEKLEKELAFENIDPEYFQFTGKSDVFLSESGVLLSITDESFLLNGKSYKGEAIVQWQEAQKASDIVKAGLSTKSGDKLLETQGMFSLNAFTPDGKKLQLTDKGVYVQVPVDELKKDMKLFTGVPGKNGTIDWQNPVELERLPKPKDMAKMDLFPPRYEPKLNELKWFKEKAKRDSLYLSFEEEKLIDSTTVTNEDIQRPRDITYQAEGKQVPAEGAEDKVQWSFSVQPLGNDEAMVVADVIIEKGWQINGLNLPKGRLGELTVLELKESPKFKLLGVISEGTIMKAGGFVFHSGRAQFRQKIKLISGEPFILNGFYTYQPFNNSYALPPFEGTFSLKVNALKSSDPIVAKNLNGKGPHIPPSKVLAVWNKKFNNTNLATQDFEDRMKEIHETCSEKVFDVYANNLNTSLWELDQRVVKLGYPKFQRFADQKVGKIKVDDIHQKSLNAFYEKAIEEIRARGKNELQAALKKERRWDTELQDERSKEVMRKGLRESTNLNEEYGFNLRNVYKQLGVTAGFQMHGGGTIVNIDKYVWDATVARQSTLITDPQTGKTAQITYEPLKLEVNQSEQYDKLFLYLFPKEINSYQRIDFKEGKLDYNLNGDMNYHAIIVGMNEKGFFYHQINELKAEDLGTVSLKEISEKDFDKRINILNDNRIRKAMSMKDELKWLFKENANYAVQKKRRENVAFRMKIRPTIYSCVGLTEAEFIDSDSIIQ